MANTNITKYEFLDKTLGKTMIELVRGEKTLTAVIPDTTDKKWIGAVAELEFYPPRDKEDIENDIFGYVAIRRNGSSISNSGSRIELIKEDLPNLEKNLLFYGALIDPKNDVVFHVREKKTTRKKTIKDKETGVMIPVPLPPIVKSYTLKYEALENGNKRRYVEGLDE